MQRDKQRVLNIRLPRELLTRIDQLIEQGTFSSRSDAIRQFSREFINGGGAWRS